MGFGYASVGKFVVIATHTCFLNASSKNGGCRIFNKQPFLGAVLALSLVTALAACAGQAGQNFAPTPIGQAISRSSPAAPMQASTAASSAAPQDSMNSSVPTPLAGSAKKLPDTQGVTQPCGQTAGCQTTCCPPSFIGCVGTSPPNPIQPPNPPSQPCTLSCGSNGNNGSLCAPPQYSNGRGGCIGGGADVSTVPPASGDTCDQSPGQLGLSNIASTGSGSQSGNASTVDDIFSLKSSPETFTAYAWVYETGNGDYFIQYNPSVGGSAASKWLGSVLSGVPFAGPGLTATITAIVNVAANPAQISAQDWTIIQQSISESNSNGSGPVVHHCFTSKLALG